jgi:hypothetical protein
MFTECVQNNYKIYLRLKYCRTVSGIPKSYINFKSIRRNFCYIQKINIFNFVFSKNILPVVSKFNYNICTPKSCLKY